MNDKDQMVLNIILREVEKSISKPSFDTWFIDLSLKIEEQTITIIAPNEYVNDWLQQKYIDQIYQWLTSYDYNEEYKVIQVTTI